MSVRQRALVDATPVHSVRATAPCRAVAGRPLRAVRFQALPAAPARNESAAALVAVTSIAASLLLCAGADARPAGVNRPDLLPTEATSVIDVAGFLTPSEERRIAAQLNGIEQDTGFKVRLLAQNYPDTPGLAVREFWGVDEKTIVFVADPTFGDILNFNVGQEVDLEVPRSFWSRLSGKFGNKFFWQEKGEATAILNAVTAIDNCLREPSGKLKCSNVQGDDSL